VSTDARTLRQFAELARAGHLSEFNLGSLDAENAALVNQMLELNHNVGGPVVKVLERLANVVATREQHVSELSLAVAGPRSSAKLVLSLPILVFVGAGIAGLPIFKALSQPSIVWLSLGLGVGLFWLGNRWTNSLLAKAQPTSVDPGLNWDLLGVAIQAGLPLSAARDYIPVDELHELQELTDGGGVALSQLIAERADTARNEQFNRDRMRIQKTSVSVLWPLGLTVLPAFVLMAVVPIGAALLLTGR